MIRQAMVIGAIFLVLGGKMAEPAEVDRRISTSGDAEIRVTPDEVVIRLGIETNDPDLLTAKSQNNRQVRETLEALANLDIPHERLQTDHIGIEPIYEHRHNIATRFFRCRKSIAVTLRDIERIEDVLTASIEHGVNFVHGVEFRTTKLREHRDRARAMAIRAAKEKAEALASELGQTIGLPITIGEGYYGWWYHGGSSWWGSYGSSHMSQNVSTLASGSSGASEASIAPGLISVSARVNVTFELIAKAPSQATKKQLHDSNANNK